MDTCSFHTHTVLCKHASGKPVDYVMQAMEEGCSALGISDHCPYPDDTWKDSRMAPSQVSEYKAMIGKARTIAPFPFYWGFECEWHPKFEGWYRDFLRAESGAEYLVYGSHWYYDDGRFEYVLDKIGSDNLRKYVELTVSGIRSGLFDLMAHPDLFLAGYHKLSDDVKAACRDIIDAAVGSGLPLEVNGLGLTRPKVEGDSGKRHAYPVREFWEMASDAGAVIICNSDAHRPEDVLKGARRAGEYLDSIGIAAKDAKDALGFIYDEKR